MRRLWLARILVTGLLAGALIHMVRDVRATTIRCQRPEPIATASFAMGDPAWQRLADFAWWVEATVPEGTIVAVRAQPNRIEVARRLSYLLPRHKVFPIRSRKLPESATYAASFGGPWRSVEPLEPLARHPDGWIYRRP